MEKQSLATISQWEETVGDDVRRLRHRQRLTQVELAARANVSLSALKNLESGKGSTLTTVIRVARALGRIEWLSSLAPSEPSVSPMAALQQRRQSAAAQRVRHGAARHPTQ